MRGLWKPWGWLYGNARLLIRSGKGSLLSYSWNLRFQFINKIWNSIQLCPWKMNEIEKFRKSSSDSPRSKIISKKNFWNSRTFVFGKFFRNYLKISTPKNIFWNSRTLGFAREIFFSTLLSTRRIRWVYFWNVSRTFDFWGASFDNKWTHPVLYWQYIMHLCIQKSSPAKLSLSKIIFHISNLEVIITKCSNFWYDPEPGVHCPNPTCP